MRKFKKGFRKFLLSPYTGAIVAGLAVFAGFIVSIYSNEIKNSFPFYLKFDILKYGSVSYPAIFSWIVLIFFLLTTAFRQRFKDSEMDEKRETLINTIQSLPPHDFAMKYMAEYRKTFVDVEKLIILSKEMEKDSDKDNDAKDLETMEETIRTILDVYVNLAQFWDSPDSLISEDTVYRANIMFYYAINEIPKPLEDKLFSMKNFFVERNIEALKTSIDGVLVLENNKFTTTTITRKPLPDNEVKPFCLPVTFSGSDNKRDQNLPGAPRALVKNDTQWILDTSEIIDRCNKNENLDGVTKKKIELYYLSDTKGKSIISMPLQLLLETDDYHSIGVVNIYRNKSMMLYNEIRAIQFSAFIEPFNSLLCKAISGYVAASKAIE